MCLRVMLYGSVGFHFNAKCILLYEDTTVSVSVLPFRDTWAVSWTYTVISIGYLPKGGILRSWGQSRLKFISKCLFSEVVVLSYIPNNNGTGFQLLHNLINVWCCQSF